LVAGKGRGFQREGDERGLKGIVHVMVVPKQTTAHTPNQASMPLDECRERFVILELTKPCQ
jgi:hypothetical protein